uniref:Uncharacterized protein n=1 Tax=Quercus lobata TaxID=97700 RepID=A0A7N2M020_QUELO
MTRRNRIVGLKNNNDVWCTFDEQIYEIMVSFYKNLFTSAHLPASRIVLDAISPSSTDEMNADLIKVFTRTEVEFALKHMEPLKAPGPDVSTLIDHDRRGWRDSEIDRNFLPSKVAIIKAIPLSFSMSADSIYWPKTPDGIYSIKSRYKLILKEDGKDVAGVATANVMKGVWSRIWKLKVPNRVRNLL